MPNDYRNLQPPVPRGIRNNNPTNVTNVFGGWAGQVDTDGDFAVFKDMSWGVRAWLLNFYSSYNNHNTTTLRQYISRFAPPNENDTTAYIQSISDYTGIQPDEQLPLDQASVTDILKGQLIVEVGDKYAEFITDKDIIDGFSLLDNKLSTFFSATALKVNTLLNKYPYEIYGTAGLLLVGSGLLVYLIKMRKKKK
jgi:hypothetical protein